MKIATCLLLIASQVLAEAPSVTPWVMLTQGATEESSARRAGAIAALGTLGTPQAERLVAAALNDKSPLVRLAAVSAIGEQKSRAAIPKLRLAVDDEAAEVSFLAAKTLWEMGDRSGAELLAAVLSGDQKTSPGFIKKQMRDAKSTLHNPRKLAWIGAKEGAGLLIGPLGFGVGVAESITHDGAAPARAYSATLLGQSKTAAARMELEEGLDDKSPLVRVAVAKSLGGFSDRALIPKLQQLLDDKSEPVRYMAAASILRIEKGKTRAR